MQSQRAGTVANLSGLYDEDFFEWTRRDAELLRAGRFGEADIGHIAEELEDMGQRDLKELNSRIQVLLSRLLKWQVRPEKRTKSWNSTIVAQRLEIEAILEQSPSLKPRIHERLPENHAGAVRRASAETGLPPDRFPAGCPYTVDQILHPEFLP